MAKKKSWKEKLLDNKGLPKVEPITDKISLLMIIFLRLQPEDLFLPL